MVKLEISKANISKAFLKLVLAEKWLTLIVFAASIIQLLSREGARYEFNVPIRYLIIKQKSMNMIKNIFG